MKQVIGLLMAGVVLTPAQAQEVKRDIPYTDKPDKLQTLDVYSPSNAKNLPVVFWIHGGGWQAGDKTDVQIKPKVFMDKGFVFVSACATAHCATGRQKTRGRTAAAGCATGRPASPCSRRAGASRTGAGPRAGR